MRRKESIGFPCLAAWGGLDHHARSLCLPSLPHIVGTRPRVRSFQGRSALHSRGAFGDSVGAASPERFRAFSLAWFQGLKRKSAPDTSPVRPLDWFNHSFGCDSSGCNRGGTLWPGYCAMGRCHWRIAWLRLWLSHRVCRPITSRHAVIRTQPRSIGSESLWKRGHSCGRVRWCGQFGRAGARYSATNPV